MRVTRYIGGKADKTDTKVLAGNFGQMFCLSDLLLPPDLLVDKYCALYDKECDNPECRFSVGGKCKPPLWKFTWDFSVERL